MILVVVVSCVFLLDPLAFNSRRIEAAALLPLLLAVILNLYRIEKETCIISPRLHSSSIQIQHSSPNLNPSTQKLQNFQTLLT